MAQVRAAALLCLLAGCTAGAAPPPTGYELIEGSFAAGRGPDGNSVFLDAPAGLILVDTGRHPEHQEKLLALARARGKPIAAIVNTHWHLDHSGGNAEIRAAYPAAEIHASNAVEGALKGFLPRSRAQAEQFLKSGKASPELEAEIRRDFAAMDDPASLRATDPITGARTLDIAGRRLTLNLASYAATEGDVWIHDAAAGLVIAGDLVVAMVPFMDTACPDGWRRALGEIAATPFTILIPGHGATMTKPQFLAWRGAFDNLLDCAASARPQDECVAGWRRDAAAFIPPGDKRVDGMVAYYIDSRLRAAPEERNLYCHKS